MNTEKIKEGDVILINCDDYKGKATVTYIDWPNIYNHQFLPIQVELDPSELHQFDDNNHGQTMRRFSIRDIDGADKTIEVKQEEEVAEEEQLVLF